MALLEVRDLAVSVAAGGAGAVAVDGVGLTADAGEVLCLVGESGCGKTLTALAIARLLPASCRVDAGEVRLAGQDLLALPEEGMRRVRGAAIGFVFQEPLTSLNPVFTIGDQIADPLRIHRRLDRRAARRRVLELLASVGISDPERRADQYPHELSGGMRQRAVIAMALACRPQLLIADEPTTALDVTVQAQVLGVIRGLQRELRMATLLITHDLGVVAQVADRVAVMYAGRIVEEGPVRQVFARPGHPYTEALLASMPARAPEGARLPVIPGVVPPVAEPPPGCRFGPRCLHRREPCATLPRGFSTPCGEGHRAACIRDVGYRHDLA